MFGRRCRQRNRPGPCLVDHKCFIKLSFDSYSQNFIFFSSSPPFGLHCPSILGSELMASAPEREGLPLPFSNLDTRSCSPATYLSARDGLSADTEAVPSPDPDLESGIVRQLMSPVATFRLSQEEPAVVALRGGNRPPRAVNDDSLTASTVSNTSTASSKTTDSTATATRADATTHSSNSTSIRTNPFLSAAASSITTTPAHSTHRVSANGEKQPSRPPTPYPGTSRCSGGDGGDNSHSQDNIHGSGNNTKAKTLSAYHLVTISIGASIGTGLFLGTGTSLARAGPAGSLLAYALVASVLYSVMESLAEMGAYAPPQAGGGGVAAGFAAAWVGEGVAFAVGWVYWFGCE